MQRIGALPAWAQLAGRGHNTVRAEPVEAQRAQTLRQAQGERRGDGAPVVDRFEGGVLPADWNEVVGQLHTQASALLKVFEALATQLKANARDNPGDAARCARLYSRLGVLAPRLQNASKEV